LHRGTSGPFTPQEATNLLHLNIDKTHKFLAYLADKGWLTHVRRGLYSTVPLDVLEPTSWKEDPWIIASKVFPPCYIGGWTACEHWGLTEQIFKETIVISSRPVRRRHIEIQGVHFIIKVVSNNKLFGTDAVWRGRTRVTISDPSRTIVDVFDDPNIGGGIRNVSDILQSYLSHTHRNDSLLLGYAHRLGNRSVFKRLGYLLEAMNVGEANLIDECRKSISTGISLLDPTATHKGRVVRKWNLRINVNLDSAKETNLDKQNGAEREGSRMGS